jgi:hypothetical protein
LAFGRKRPKVSPILQGFCMILISCSGSLEYDQ